MRTSDVSIRHTLLECFQKGSGLQGAWLEPRLEKQDLTHAQLGKCLGLQAPQVASWFSDKESIPSQHRARAVEILNLSAYDAHELNLIAETTARIRELERQFAVTTVRSRRSGTRLSPLGTWFQAPASIFHRIRSRIAQRLAEDCAIFPQGSPVELLHTHVDAATRAVNDLSAYLSQTAFNLFHERNIWSHLRFPHHCYLGYFYTDVSQADGPDAPLLQKRILQGLEACATLRDSNHAAEARAGQHALHLLSRFRNEPMSGFAKSANPETRRMGFFGTVYRLYDHGPFEELARLITCDNALGLATFAFDGLHYRDFKPAGRTQLKTELPRNAMARHLALLADPRISMRHVACARLWNTLQRLDENSLSDPRFFKTLLEKRHVIEGFRPEGSLQTRVHHDLLGRISTPISQS